MWSFHFKLQSSITPKYYIEVYVNCPKYFFWRLNLQVFQQVTFRLSIKIQFKTCLRTWDLIFASNHVSPHDLSFKGIHEKDCLVVCEGPTRFFFYKNKLYKNTQAEICPKIKNKLRTITRLKFWSENLKKFIISFHTEWDVCVYENLLGLAGSSSAGWVISSWRSRTMSLYRQFQNFSPTAG